MNPLTIIATFFVAVLFVNTGRSQTSVYDCLFPVQNSDVTSPSIVETGACFDFSHPSNYYYPAGVNKEFRAYKSIHVEDDFKMGSSASMVGKFTLTMANTDIVLYEPNDINNIMRYEKMELGVDLPDNIQARVDAFIANETDPNGLNPFLDWKIKIQATFVHVGSGFTNRKVDAFYFRDFERVIIPYTGPNFVNNDDIAYKDWGGNWKPKINNHPFRIRFAPTEVGVWTCKINVFINGSTTPSFAYDVFSFKVVPSGNPGFVKVGANKHYFTRGKETFVPIGPNFGWPATYAQLDPVDFAILKNGGIGNTEAHRHFTAPLQTYLNYETHLNEIADAGANHFRMLMVPWSLDIEFEKLGNYYDRQNIAWEMDNIVNTAKQNNLNIQWDLLIQYNLEGKPFGIMYWDWYASDEYDDFGVDINTLDVLHYPPASLIAYDKGYCYHNNSEFTAMTPYEMFTNPLAKKYYKQRLRYIISRWGYSTNVGMWELFSEINNAGAFSGESPPVDERPYHSSNLATSSSAQNIVESWHREMADYIKNTLGDPHLISASYGGDIGSFDNTHNLAVIDIASENHYNGHSSPKFVYDISKQYSYIDRMRASGGGKPVSFSEHGDPHGSCEGEFEFKRGLWMQTFSGTAIANDWDVWLHPEKWNRYKDIRDFIGHVDFDGDNWISGPYTTGYTAFPSAWNDMQRGDWKADMVYLQSGDKNYAMGVINNRTYNPYSLTSFSSPSCSITQGVFNDNPADGIEDVDFRVKEIVAAEITPSNWLRVRNMKTSSNPILYVIEYFNIDAPTVLIGVQLFTVTSFNENIILEYPDLNDDHPIIAFRIYPRDLGWKSMVVQEGGIETTPKQTISIYPNPTNSLTTVVIDNFDSDNKNYKMTLFNAQGKLMETINVNSEKFDVDLSTYENGIYFLLINDGFINKSLRIVKTE